MPTEEKDAGRGDTRHFACFIYLFFKTSHWFSMLLCPKLFLSDKNFLKHCKEISLPLGVVMERVYLSILNQQRAQES